MTRDEGEWTEIPAVEAGNAAEADRLFREPGVSGTDKGHDNQQEQGRSLAAGGAEQGADAPNASGQSEALQKALSRLNAEQREEFARQRHVRLEVNGQLTPDYEARLANLIGKNLPEKAYGRDLSELNRRENNAVFEMQRRSISTPQDREPHKEAAERDGGQKDKQATPHRNAHGQRASKEAGAGESQHDGPHRPGAMAPMTRDAGRNAGAAEKQSGHSARDRQNELAALAQSITNKIAAREHADAVERRREGSPARQRADAVFAGKPRPNLREPEKNRTGQDNGAKKDGVDLLTPQRLRAWSKNQTEKRQQLNLPEEPGLKRELARMEFDQGKAESEMKVRQTRERQLLTIEHQAERVSHGAKFLARDMKARELKDAAQFEAEAVSARDCARAAREQRLSLRLPRAEREEKAVTSRQAAPADQARRTPSGSANRGQGEQAAVGKAAPEKAMDKSVEEARRIEAREKAFLAADGSALTSDRLQRMLERYDDLRTDRKLPRSRDELRGREQMAERHGAESKALVDGQTKEAALLDYQHQAERAGVGERWLAASMRKHGMPEGKQHVENMRRAFHIVRFCLEGRDVDVDRWQAEKFRPSRGEDRSSWRSAMQITAQNPNEVSLAEGNSHAQARLENRSNLRSKPEGKLRTQGPSQERGRGEGRGGHGRAMCGGGRGR
jgi:hypothetical protein